MRSLATDPLRNFKFIVTIAATAPVPTSIGRLGFMTADGLGIQNEVIPYREGGDNTVTRKMPGQTDFGPITLGRGSMAAPQGINGQATAGSGTSEIYQWLGQVFSAMEGQGTGNDSDNFRTNLTIDVLEHPTVDATFGAGINSPPPIKVRFYVMNAWPMGLNWSGLDAGGNATVIETLQLAHEGFVVNYASQQPGNYVSSSWSPSGASTS